MRCHRDEIRITTTRRFQLIDITEEIRGVVTKSGVTEGQVLVFSPHTTAAIRINEMDARLHEDMERFLDRLSHPEGPYRHNLRTVDDRPNAWGHLMGLIMNASAVIPLSGGEAELGRWQSVFFVELDGPRENRKALVRVMGA
jgi:secondary thiamine-phosphate synthase enzyme